MQKGNRSMKSIGFHQLRSFSACYIALPVVIFLGGFLKWYFALPGICAVGYSLYQIIRYRKPQIIQERTINLSSWGIVGVFVVMLIWTHLGGMNGYWYQSSDYSARNAIFRDLITHSWPVTYQNGSSALVYYIGHWLPAAVIGKTVHCLFQSAQITWMCAQVALWIWSSFGLTILTLLLFLYVQADNRKKRLITIIVFVFFSGMDIIGTLLEQRLRTNFSAGVLHLEWWSPKYWQYSSLTTCLYWVFNQAIVPWIVVMLVLIDSDSRNYILYISSCLICAPMPAVGLCLLMMGKECSAIVTAIRIHDIKCRVRGIISSSNILILITCIPIIASYILCSSAAGDIEAKTVIARANSLAYSIYEFGLFYALEAGILLIVLWPNNKKNIVFYLAGLSLLVFPFVHVGTGNDFCMRGSIPAVYLLMVFSIQRLIMPTRKKEKGRGPFFTRTLTVCLVIILFIGAMTPVMEIYRGLYNVFSAGKIQLTDDKLFSFENETDSYNFTSKNYKDHLFFHLFSNSP